MKYRKKPVIIEAFQWRNRFNHIITEFDPYEENEEFTCGHCNEPAAAHGLIKTLDGGHIVCPGDYIITGSKGKRYPCKPDIFSLTYEPIEEEGK